MPAIPPQSSRRSLRLRNYGYAQAGAYFITICTQRRARFFENAMIHAIVEQCWLAIPEHVPFVELDEWVVMPNHVHGIIVIDHADNDFRRADAPNEAHSTGVQLNAHASNDNALQCNSDIDTIRRDLPARDRKNRYSMISPHRDTLAVVVRTYKAAVTMRFRRAGYNDFGWQRNYHERIIR